MNALLSTNIACVGGADVTVIARSCCIRAVIGVCWVDTRVGRTFANVEGGRIIVVAFVRVVTTGSHSRRIEYR